MALNHAFNQKIELHWNSGEDLSVLLAEAAEFVKDNDNYCEVHTRFDFDGAEYVVEVFVHA